MFVVGCNGIGKGPMGSEMDSLDYQQNKYIVPPVLRLVACGCRSWKFRKTSFQSVLAKIRKYEREKILFITKIATLLKNNQHSCELNVRANEREVCHTFRT